MEDARQRLLRLGARGGTRLARWRIERSRRLRWAVRVPTVTLAASSLVSAMVLIGVVASAGRPRR